MQNLVIALVGPTAVGKTEVALALADRHRLSLISLDSTLVYRGMDIGTAKPSAEVLERYPHALIDIHDPLDAYSAAQFLNDADAEVRRAWAQGTTPVLVGGTMLYLKAFRQGLAAMPSADPELRARLASAAREDGAGRTHARLQSLDPVAAGKIHPNNSARVQRALEVFELTGRPISSFWSNQSGVAERLGGRLVEFAIEPDDRLQLHARIERRFDTMLEAGFVDEVAGLRDRGDLHLELPAMRAVGYRQIWQYLEGSGTRQEMRESALAATRRLAKRQLTWMRATPTMESLEWGKSQQLARDIAQRAHLANP